MAGLKEIRKRLATVASTRQLTSAMKMVSASKLRKAQNQQLRLRGYMQDLSSIFRAVVEAGGDDAQLRRFIEGSEQIKSVVIMVFTSDKGLCGTFNNNVCKAVEEHIKTNYKNTNVELLCFGTKGEEYFKSRGYKLYDLPVEMSPGVDVDLDNISYKEISNIATMLMGSFYYEEVDRVDAAFYQPVNAAKQNLILRTLLPVASFRKDPPLSNALSNTAKKAAEKPIDYIMQPSRLSILKDLLPMLFSVGVYSILVASQVSEHGSRMMAMSKASDNADELNKNLNRQYNKLRQSAITNELLEIVSGANALS